MIVFDSLTIAKKALDATNDQQLMGYKLLITLRHPSVNHTDMPSIEQKPPLETSNAESLVLAKPTSSTEKPVEVNHIQENGFRATLNGDNRVIQTSTHTQISSIPSTPSILASDQKTEQPPTTPQKLLFEQLADVFLKDLKNRVAGPSIHDFLKSARAKRLEKENTTMNPSEDTNNDFVKLEQEGPSQQQKIIESLVNSSSKLPRFKKKQKALPPIRDYDSFTYHEQQSSHSVVEKLPRATTPVLTTYSSSEEGEYHSGLDEGPVSETRSVHAIENPLDRSVRSHSSSPPPPIRRLSKKPVVPNRPRGLRDYLSDEESDVDEHDAFLKQLHRQEEFIDDEDESESDDFVENDYEENHKRKRANIKKPTSKKQKKVFYSDEDTSEYDSTSKVKLKQQKKKQVRKKKKQQLQQEPLAPVLPERIYEVMEEVISKDSSSSGMDEEDEEEEEEEEVEPKVEFDQEAFERSLLASDGSDSEELIELQPQNTDPPEWDPFNQIEDPEEYCFFRAALLDRAGIELNGKKKTSLRFIHFLIY